VARGHRQHERGAYGSRLDGLSKQARNKRFHMVFSRLNRRSPARRRLAASMF
jgi:hypothetical protein